MLNERKNVSERSSSAPLKRVSSRLANAKASQAIIEAKQKAIELKKLQDKKEEASLNTPIDDIYEKCRNALQDPSFCRKPTGLVYEDMKMLEHKCIWDENYPERPERLSAILKRCQQLGLIDRCKIIEPRAATRQELLIKHDQRHIDDLQITKGVQDYGKLEALSSKYDAIFLHPSTYDAACLAAGSTIDLVEKVCKGEIQNGMAIVRPPGHHAMEQEYCGYCFFNNVAIAVDKALSEKLANKVLIVDWDVHHGQATQQMFYNDPRVVYFSIHRYENGEFWPNLRESNFDYIGEGEAIGYNFNVPLNKTGMKDADYLAIFQQLLLPMAYEFQPDLVVVSAGYDAAIGCPEGEMEVSPACYSHLVSSLMSLASGRVAVVVEGGYYLRSLAEGAALTLATLLGDPCPLLQDLDEPSQSVCDTILSVIYAQKPYWHCYQYQETYSINSIVLSDSKDVANRFCPVLIFKGNEEKPSVYATRNCYPEQSKETKECIEHKLGYLERVTNLEKAKNRVGLIYDTAMMQHQDPSDDAHPEQPQRIHGIWAKCHEAGLSQRCYMLKSRLATEEELQLVHEREYIEQIRASQYLKKADLKKLGSTYESVYMHPKTWNSACLAAGSLLQMVDSVVTNEVQNGVAIVRPPGHHATQDAACGFCFFNNVALAAKYAVEFHQLKRVLIVDWDVHHGNGIQSIVEDDPRILYISLHRYDRATFFPNSKDANYDKVGVGPGEGFIVNIPWNTKKMGDAEYAAAFQQVVLPIAYQFRPELVLVSAGFDACVGDPLGGYKVTPEMYGHLTHWLSSLANGRIILSLEGGYSVNSIAYAMSMCVKALLGDPLPLLKPFPKPHPSAVITICNVLDTQSRYWPNLRFRMELPKELDTLTQQPILEDLMTQLKIRVSADEKQQEQQKQEPSGQSDGASGSQQASVGASSTDGASGLTLDNFLSENLLALMDEKMFAVIPLNDCPHLGSVNPVPDSGIETSRPCEDCGSCQENWVCLDCYKVHCARNVNQHALQHYELLQHPVNLSITDLSVWCYACEAYIDNPKLYEARNALHNRKFGQALPWTYSS